MNKQWPFYRARIRNNKCRLQLFADRSGLRVAPAADEAKRLATLYRRADMHRGPKADQRVDGVCGLCPAAPDIDQRAAYFERIYLDDDAVRCRIDVVFDQLVAKQCLGPIANCRVSALQLDIRFEPFQRAAIREFCLDRFACLLDRCRNTYSPE